MGGTGPGEGRRREERSEGWLEREGGGGSRSTVVVVGAV